MSDTASIRAAGFCFGIATFVIALYLASQMGSEVKWLSSKPLVNQPGFWPVMAVCGMVLFGVLQLLSMVRSRAFLDLKSATSEFGLWVRALEFVGWFLAYVMIVPQLGYLPTTLVFAAALAWRLGYRDVKMLLAACIFAFVTVLIFKSFLAVKIPGGAVYEYLPAQMRNFMIINF